MEPVLTKDGTITFFNEKFQEHYHCLAGALAEAEIKHVLPAKEYISEGCVIIDFCFGLGYNTLATLFYAKNKGIKSLHVIALESDLEIIKKISALDVPSEYSVFKEGLSQLASKNKVVIEGYTVELLLGDAAQKISEIAVSPSVVFFDPFSPKKHPELWSQDIFSRLFSLMCSGSVLTTYSCATHVREKMRTAGFRVIDGPIFGRKSASTLAIKD